MGGRVVAAVAAVAAAAVVDADSKLAAATLSTYGPSSSDVEGVRRCSRRCWYRRRWLGRRETLSSDGEAANLRRGGGVGAGEEVWSRRASKEGS